MVPGAGESMQWVRWSADSRRRTTTSTRTSGIAGQESEDRVGRDSDGEGYVDMEFLQRLLPDNDFDFYLCGPTPFMQSLFAGLVGWGVPGGRIHYEFSVRPQLLRIGHRSQLLSEWQERPSAAVTWRLRSPRQVSRRTGIPHSKASSDLAEANGLSPDYSCRTGICHHLCSPLENGDVEYVLDPLDPPDPGSVLICCAKPKTNVVVCV